MVCRQIYAKRRLLLLCVLIHIASLCMLAYLLYEHVSNEHGSENDPHINWEEVAIRNKQDDLERRSVRKNWNLPFCTFNIAQCASGNVTYYSPAIKYFLAQQKCQNATKQNCSTLRRMSFLIEFLTQKHEDEISQFKRQTEH